MSLLTLIVSVSMFIIFLVYNYKT